MSSLLKLGVGLALIPSAALSLWLAAKCAAGLASASPMAAPLIAGAAAALLSRVLFEPEGLVGRALKVGYVFGHELTHAAFAWGAGAKVYSFEAGERGGHVDLSHSNALIALAPYCFPIYAIALVLGYRGLLWLKPGAVAPELFLALLGGALGFHLLFTVEALWSQKQPDLAAAGGSVFSLSVIGLVNGLGLLLWLKALFPKAVPLSQTLAAGAAQTRAFWMWVAALFA